MFIKNLTFQGYGPFKDVSVNLWSEEQPDRKVTVLIGENGAGKSAFLEATATLLSWLPARIRSEKSAGSSIDDLKIYSGFPAATLRVLINMGHKDYSWSLAKIAKGRRAKAESSLKDASLLASALSNSLETQEKCSLPLIGFYPTERYVLDIPKKIRTRHSFKQINGYESALTKGIDFRRFFEWFRDREDIRNEGKIDFEELIPFIDHEKLLSFVKLRVHNRPLSIDDMISVLNNKKMEKLNKPLFSRVQNRAEVQSDPQYFAVLRALEIFMPGYTGLRIERRPRMRMLIDKMGIPLDILQLSQGEKSLLALIGDIARRLAIMNPSIEDPLQGEGVVLIDEVELHLHPRWQRTIVRNLRKTFPNCQFILTTHSPLVVSDPDNTQILALKNGSISEMANLYGMDIEQVFLEIMDTPLRHPVLQQKIDSLLEAIQDKELVKAKKLRKELGNILPPDHRELVRADIYLRRQEVLNAKNNEKR